MSNISFSTLQDVIDYTQSLLKTHLVFSEGWTVVWNSRYYSTLGSCNCYKKRIQLSKSRFECNLDKTEVLINIVKHEVAHALAGFGHKHDALWRHYCQVLGCHPEVHFHGNLPCYSYVFECPKCGHITYSNKKTTIFACSACCKKYNNNKFSEEFQYVLKSGQKVLSSERTFTSERSEKLTVYKSYFANAKNLPEGCIKTAICYSVPRGFGIWNSVVPPADLVFGYKRGDVSEESYKKIYWQYLLERKEQIAINVSYMKNNPQQIYCLLCYEKEGFCHRDILADFLETEFELEVTEYSKG